MNDKTRNESAGQELSLAEILQIVLENKVRIGALSIATGVLAALYLLLLPNVYQSSTALVIRPPEIKLTGEAAPLDPEMLLALTNSTEVKRAVFDIASASKYLEADSDFRLFQRDLETTVQTRRGPVRDLVPMIELIARATDPTHAKELANLWAQITVEKSKEIYARGISEQSDFVGGFYDAIENALNSAESEFATRTMTANLDLKNAQLSTQVAAQALLDKELFEARQKLKSNKVLMQELRGRLSGQEQSGMWIGDYLERALMAGGDVQSASVSPSSATIAHTVSQMVGNRRRYYEFLTESDYFLKRSTLDNWVEQMGLVVKELSAASKELSVKENRYLALAVRSATLTPTFTLTKAITDDPLWEEYLKSGDKGQLEFPTLKSEFENANYYSFQKDLIQLSVDVATLEEQVKDLKRRELRLSERVDAASAELAVIAREKEIQESGIERDRALLDFMKEDYKKETQELQSLEVEQVRLINSIALKDQNLDAIDETRNALATEVFSSSQELGALQRKLENMEAITKTMAMQAAEIQLLKDSARMGTRAGGTTVLYQAEVNPQKVGPRRTRNVSLTMAVAVLVLSVYFVGIRLVRPA